MLKVIEDVEKENTSIPPVGGKIDTATLETSLALPSKVVSTHSDLAVAHLGMCLSTIAIMGWVILYCGRANLSVVECRVSGLYPQDANSIMPSRDNEKCLLAFLKIPWEANL